MTETSFIGGDLEAAVATLREGTALDDRQITALFEHALVDAYRRLTEDTGAVRAHLDLGRGVWQLVHVAEDGAETPVVITSADYPRQAAHAARTAVGLALREAEMNRTIRQAETKRFELVDGVVSRRSGPVWYLDVGGMDALLPPEEQIAGEELQLRQHLKVMVLEGRRRSRDAVIVVSRSHPQLLRLLLEQEVPELQSGEVVIRGIAREPGRRAKVAVDCPGGTVDPQGACIGPRGVRHRAVTSELGAEQVQIVAWSADQATFVANSLIPATVTGVTLDEATRTAHAVVAPDQLSLAIGRAGENARLAARLTGWRVDIRGEE